MSIKPGRNDPCPCGSGNKFKRCHGSINSCELRWRAEDIISQKGLPKFVPLYEAKEFQRRVQQGLGKPIISNEYQDHRVIAVGGAVHFSQRWKTFHDFLNDYPKIVLGREWWMSEVSRPAGDQHRILTWATHSYRQFKAHVEQQGVAAALPMTGAVGAYMRFAYDLYTLKHAVEVEKLLIDRIRCHGNFPGALYEVRVAAALLRAGFSLVHQDETDRSSTHVEFIATHIASGAIYSVEAKRREGERLKINRQMYRALKKHSDHPRIIFIDVNDRRLGAGRGNPNPIPLVEAEIQLQRYERDPTGKALPEAYVIVTYEPEEHHLDAIDLTHGMLFWGFHQEDLHPGAKTLLQQVETRRRHAPVFALLESMQKHRRIPASFDGEADAYMAQSSRRPLNVGERVGVTGADGAQIDATIESGVVMPEQGEAWCIVCTAEGRRSLIKLPLSPEELQAYNQHPETFFGVIDRNAGRPAPKTGLHWFDFLWEAYANTSKDRLIELMTHAPDIEQLKTMTQEDLATAYCTRMADSMMNTPGG